MRNKGYVSGLVLVIILGVIASVLAYSFLHKVPQKINSTEQKRVFENIDNKDLLVEYNVPNLPNNLYLMTSIYSPDKSKVVYAAIDKAIFENHGSADAIYYVEIYDTVKDETTLVYSKNVVGGMVVYLPLAWTPTGKSIIYKWINPTDIGRGGAPESYYYKGPAKSGEIMDLGEFDAVFTTNYDRIIKTINNPDFYKACGGGQLGLLESNYGKIVIADIDSGNTVTLLREINTKFSDLKMSGENILTYKESYYKNDTIVAYPSKEVIKCVSVDENKGPVTKTAMFK